MSQKYTRAETIVQIKEAVKDMPSFYRAACVNHTGTTYKSDGNEYYTEIISDFLLCHYELFDQIERIKREAYKVETHTGTTPRPTSNRLEERIALSLFQKELRPIGKIIDYQIPLKNKQEDDAGKIDLMSFDETTGVLRLIELKAPKSKETLLRCVLEIYTYYKTVDIDALKKSFGLTDKCTEVRICPLFFMNSTQDKEYNDFHSHPCLCELMKKISEKSAKVELLRFPFENVGLVSSALQSIPHAQSTGSYSNSSAMGAESVPQRCNPKMDPVISVVHQPNGFPLGIKERPDDEMKSSEMWKVEILNF